MIRHSLQAFFLQVRGELIDFFSGDAVDDPRFAFMSGQDFLDLRFEIVTPEYSVDEVWPIKSTHDVHGI